MTAKVKTARKGKGMKWRRSPFGMLADFDVPSDCYMVVVAVNGGKHVQFQPVAVRLPHQIYYADCKRWLKENDAREITILPAYRKEHYIEIGDPCRTRAASKKRKGTK